MEYIQSLTSRAKLLVVIASIFIVMLAVSLLALGMNIDNDAHLDSLHHVAHDMIYTPQEEAGH